MFLDYKKIFFDKLIIFFIICVFFIGIFNLISVIVDNNIIKLWKEFYILFLLLIIILIRNKQIYIKLKYNNIILILILMYYFVIEIIYNLIIDIPITFIAYQIKNDFFPLIFGIIIYIYIYNLGNNDYINFLRKIAKLVIILGAINAVAVILEHIFVENFLSLLGINFGNWGSSSGVKIITTGDTVRPIGFQTSFDQVGSLLLFCYILLKENKLNIIKNKCIDYLLSVIFVIGIYLSTYATAMLGLIFYILIKYSEKLLIKLKFNMMLRCTIIWFFLICVFFALFMSTHELTIYEFIAKINPMKAYNSIFTRISQHWEILNNMDSIISLFLGVGFGVNGAYGAYGIESVFAKKTQLATDSTYIYLISNYGIIGMIIFVMIFSILILYFMNKNKDVFGLKYFCIYVLVIMFFYNNIIASFTNSLILILFIILNFRLVKRN